MTSVCPILLIRESRSEILTKLTWSSRELLRYLYLFYSAILKEDLKEVLFILPCMVRSLTWFHPWCPFPLYNGDPPFLSPSPLFSTLKFSIPIFYFFSIPLPLTHAHTFFANLYFHGCVVTGLTSRPLNKKKYF